MGGEPAARMNS